MTIAGAPCAGSRISGSDGARPLCRRLHPARGGRGYLVRSPYGHAAIDRIDTAAARGAPGILGVFTEADPQADGIGPLPCVAQINAVGPIVVPPRYALARGRVRHFGDPVALIIAETCDLARDAAERIAAMGRPQPPLMARCDPTP